MIKNRLNGMQARAADIWKVLRPITGDNNFHRETAALAASGRWEDVPHRISHERRMSALLVLGKFMDDGAYWRFFRDAWCSDDCTYRYSRLLGRMTRRRGREAFMNSVEAAVFAGLPDPVPVFRGALVGVNEEGWSWSTSRDQAAWFPMIYSDQSLRVKRIENRRPILLEGRVSKIHVIGYNNGRREQEIIAPPCRVEILRRVTDIADLAQAAAREDAATAAELKARLAMAPSRIGSGRS